VTLRRKTVYICCGLAAAILILALAIAVVAPSAGAASLPVVQRHMLQNYTCAIALYRACTPGASNALPLRGRHLLQYPLSGHYRFQESESVALPDGTSVLADLWGNPIVVRSGTEGAYSLSSSGPDGKSDSDDDIIVSFPESVGPSSGLPNRSDAGSKGLGDASEDE